MMSRNIIIVLIYHRHKLLDLILGLFCEVWLITFTFVTLMFLLRLSPEIALRNILIRQKKRINV
jgi:hypothetical protein